MRNSQNEIYFQCTRLSGQSKKGVISPDANGCYTQCIGALNSFNSAGDYYDYESAAGFFQRQSAFQRRIQRGVLRAEYGHPKRLPGMTEYDYAARAMDIAPDRVCGTWREIRLSREKLVDPHGHTVIPIMGTIFPAGPFGDPLRHAFESPGEQVCFSVRCYTKDVMSPRGYIVKHICELLNYDYVNEPGIEVAEKNLSTTLECYDAGDLHDYLITRHDQNKKSASMESRDILEFAQRIKALEEEERSQQSYTRFARRWGAY